MCVFIVEPRACWREKEPNNSGEEALGGSKYNRVSSGPMRQHTLQRRGKKREPKNKKKVIPKEWRKPWKYNHVHAGLFECSVRLVGRSIRHWTISAASTGIDYNTVPQSKCEWQALPALALPLWSGVFALSDPPLLRHTAIPSHIGVDGRADIRCQIYIRARAQSCWPQEMTEYRTNTSFPFELNLNLLIYSISF